VLKKLILAWKSTSIAVRFEVLIVASMKMAIFWVVVPYSLVDVN
jgi:hypothetical protein